MRYFIHQLLIFILLFACNVFAGEKATIGWVEQVRIKQGGILLNAKIDTGADNSSIRVRSVEVFEREGENWVRFVVIDVDGEEHTLVKPVDRFTAIKRKDALPHERPVIKLGVCLGDVYHDVEVNLTDARGFNYNMLVGRSLLKGHFIVDSEVMYTTAPSCSLDDS